MEYTVDIHETIEDIILKHDRRGISVLRPYLPPHFCSHAAEYILQQHPGTVLITTGFYIPKRGAPETDGPPGALAVGSALRAFGRDVVYLAGAPLSHIISHYLTECGDPSRVIDYPVTKDDFENSILVEEIMQACRPSVIISVERCSPTASDRYLTMHGEDISEYTPGIDYFFMIDLPSVAVGDGGNEIGMGNLAEVIRSAARLPNDPAAVGCNCLVLASVSNWGGYGVAAALSLAAGRNLLPTVAEGSRCICRIIDAGGVDGVSGERKYFVDGFSLAENARVLVALHQYVDRHLWEDR